MYNEVILHHSAVKSHFDAPIDSTYDSIRNYHLSRGYSDIGYHYLISYLQTRIGRDSAFLGAHCYGHNDTLGVCFLGNYTEQYITRNQIAQLMAYIIMQINSNRLSSHFYITPHCYYRNTLCPGNIMPAILNYLNTYSNFKIIDILYGKSIKIEVRYVSEIH